MDSEVYHEASYSSPIPDDSTRVCYLVLHLGVPSNVVPTPSPEHLGGAESAEQAGQQLGIEIWPARVDATPDATRGHYSYLFRFPDWERDDHRATRFGEAMIYAISVLHGPFMDPTETSPVFRIPKQLAQDQAHLHIDTLIQLERSRDPSDRITDFPSQALGSMTMVSDTKVDAAWRMVPALVQEDNLFRAARFLTASHAEFYVPPGGIAEVLAYPDLTAQTGLEQNSFENALQNAFKAVEAIIGDPPKDDRKFFSKISAIGLDPNDPVGYATKQPLHKVIRDMNQARDKKSAHGSTPNRTIPAGELMEYQACARLVLWTAIETKQKHKT